MERRLGGQMIVKLEEDPLTGELILPLPDEIMEELDIDIGDELEWIDNEDGTFTIRKFDFRRYAQ
jgi:hypothetical protein